MVSRTHKNGEFGDGLFSLHSLSIDPSSIVYLDQWPQNETTIYSVYIYSASVYIYIVIYLFI
jgi:hypothetical protein